MRARRGFNTSAGAPTLGSFDVGDAVTDAAGVEWICTATGSPGSWSPAGAGASAASSVSVDPTGLTVVTGSDVQAAIEELDAASGGGSGTSVAMQYLEWTVDGDPEQSVVIPPGLVAFGFVGTHIAFDDAATLDLGFTGHPIAYMNGSDVSSEGQVYTANDLHGSAVSDGLPVGFAMGQDFISSFPDGTTITGTLSPGAATVGMVRFYFLPCTVTPAT